MPRLEWFKRHKSAIIYICSTILIAIFAVFAILFPSRVLSFIGDLFGAVSPVFFGFAIAYLLHPIFKLFDKKLFAFLYKFKKIKVKAIKWVCASATFLVAAAVITLFVVMVIPQLKQSYLDLESKFGIYIKECYAWLRTLLKSEELSPIASSIDIDAIFKSLDSFITSSFGAVKDITGFLVSYSSKLISIVVQVFLSLVFAAFFLVEKERIFLIASRLSSVLLSDTQIKQVRKWASYTNGVFSKFISGKVLNAILITLLNFVVFGICRIPYYPLVALVTGITDMIPYFGPFIGAIPCTVIILIADPIKAIWFVVLVLVIQQLDGNIIGPKILGERVGVDSLLVIVAITVSSGLFGIPGMFIGVPVFTVLYRVAMSFIDSRLKKKGLPTSLSYYEKEKEAE